MLLYDKTLPDPPGHCFRSFGTTRLSPLYVNPRDFVINVLSRRLLPDHIRECRESKVSAIDTAFSAKGYIELVTGTQLMGGWRLLRRPR
jgi:hypothetical protein